MVNRTASAHKGIPTTENPRERPQVNTGQQGKGLDTLPKNSVLLMSGRLAGKKRLAILTGIFMIIQSGNLYLRLIGIYQHLKTSKNISRWTGN